MGAIFKREMKAYFTSPIAYIFIAVFYIYTGFYFVQANIRSATTDTAYVFAGVFTLMMIMLPLLTMRLMSEEQKQKTDQCLLTAPVYLAEIVMGKFFAALCVFLCGMAIFIPYMLVLNKLSGGGVAWPIVFGNMTALLLLGASSVSIGILVSTLTENQIVSAVLGFVIMLVFYMIDVFAQGISVPWLRTALAAIGFYNRYIEFTNGIINITSLVFFLSVIFTANFITVRILEKRRWG